MSVLEGILEVGAMFDWITPLHAFGMDLCYALFRGASHTFLISDECGWSGHSIIKLLHSYKIRTWGHMIVNHTLMITTPKPQASLAENVLAQAQLASWILSAPAPRPRKQKSARPMPVSVTHGAPAADTSHLTVSAGSMFQLQCPYCGNVLPVTTDQCPGCGSRQLTPFPSVPVQPSARPRATSQAVQSGWDRVECTGDKLFDALHRLGL